MCVLSRLEDALVRARLKRDRLERSFNAAVAGEEKLRVQLLELNSQVRELAGVRDRLRQQHDPLKADFYRSVDEERAAAEAFLDEYFKSQSVVADAS
jgi:hypothetical protein